MSESFHANSDLPVEQLLEQVEHVAEMWGATWTRDGSGGRLELPVLAGLKHGLVSGTISIEPASVGSRVVFRVERRSYHLQASAVAILALGAIGGIAATLWPFFPVLVGVAPLAVVVAIAAWILVASRLRTSTPDEFLEMVAGDPDQSPD